MKGNVVELDVEQMLKVMNFCPMEIITKSNGKQEKTLCTRCWEWLSEHKEQGYKENKKNKDTANEIIVWDLNNKVCKKIKLNEIISHSMSNYNGQMYLK